MEKQVRYIGFGRHQVAVQTTAPEVLAALESRFAHLLTARPTEVVAWLEVVASGPKYQLLANDHSPPAEEPQGYLADVLRQLKYAAVRYLMQARPDLLWLHAGAVAHQEGAVLFIGSWGRGKSTLVTSLCQQGWRYLSDDVAPLDIASGQVWPFPLAPKVRQGDGQILDRSRLSHLNQVQVALEPDTICQEAVPVKGLVFPRYDSQSAAILTPCSPGQATLRMLEHCLNFAAHRSAAVRGLGSLASEHPAYHLPFASGNQAAQLVIQAYTPTEKPTKLAAGSDRDKMNNMVPNSTDQRRNRG